MQLQSHPFHSVKGRVLFLHWFHFMRKFWVPWLLLHKNFSFVTNPTIFFMSLYLSACLCETAWCHFLAISTFLAISAEKIDTVPTEPITSNCWAKLIHSCTYTLTDYTCVGKFPKKSSSEAVQEAAVKDPGMNESVRIASVTFGSLSCFSCLFVLQSNISSCGKNKSAEGKEVMKTSGTWEVELPQCKLAVTWRQGVLRY